MNSLPTETNEKQTTEMETKNIDSEDEEEGEEDEKVSTSLGNLFPVGR